MLVLALVLLVLVYPATSAFLGLLARLLPAAAPLTAKSTALPLTVGPVLDTGRVSAALSCWHCEATDSNCFAPPVVFSWLVARLFARATVACFTCDRNSEQQWSKNIPE